MLLYNSLTTAVDAFSSFPFLCKNCIFSQDNEVAFPPQSYLTQQPFSHLVLELCRRPPLSTKSTTRGRLFVRRPLVTGPSQELLPRFILIFKTTTISLCCPSTALLADDIAPIDPATIFLYQNGYPNRQPLTHNDENCKESPNPSGPAS